MRWDFESSKYEYKHVINNVYNDLNVSSGKYYPPARPSTQAPSRKQTLPLLSLKAATVSLCDMQPNAIIDMKSIFTSMEAPLY